MPSQGVWPHPFLVSGGAVLRGVGAAVLRGAGEPLAGVRGEAPIPADGGSGPGANACLRVDKGVARRGRGAGPAEAWTLGRAQARLRPLTREVGGEGQGPGRGQEVPSARAGPRGATSGSPGKGKRSPRAPVRSTRRAARSTAAPTIPAPSSTTPDTKNGLPRGSRTTPLDGTELGTSFLPTQRRAPQAWARSSGRCPR